jgi:hypothetical protein
MPALLVLLLTSIACLGAAPPSTSPGTASGASTHQSAAVTHELKVGASVTPAGTRVTITFVGVREDSRCPVGVTCIWEGDALVELRVQPETGSAATVELHTSDRFARQGSAHGVTIQLERLTPAPTSDGPVPAGSYLVTISTTD